jgi:uncharacterized membrane protein YeaQ/YmgE (transglycosylase-associated protein family)
MSTETVLALTPAGQSWLGFIIALVIMGLIVGAIARLIVPGPQPIGILGTILAGVAGAFLGGIVGRLLFGPGYTPGFIMSILGAAVIVFAISRGGSRGMGRRGGGLFGGGYRRDYYADEPVVDDRPGVYGGRRGGGLFAGRRGGGLFAGRRGGGHYGNRRGGGLFGRRGSYDY